MVHNRCEPVATQFDYIDISNHQSAYKALSPFIFPYNWRRPGQLVSDTRLSDIY